MDTFEFENKKDIDYSIETRTNGSFSLEFKIARLFVVKFELPRTKSSPFETTWTIWLGL